MQSNLTLIGFGVIGVESLHALVKKINKKKKFKIIVIEKDIRNIPGGVAYSKKNSKFGFFNNPVRLSHPSFISWLNKKKNISRLTDFINNNPSYFLKKWLIDNYNNLIKKKSLKEIYFPRLIYSFYLEDKIKDIVKIITKKKVLINFYHGNINRINPKKNTLQLFSNSNFKSFKIQNQNQKLNIFRLKKEIKSLETEKILLGNGLLPPKKIKINKKNNNKYIWDFYSEGGTGNLIEKINLVKRKKNNVVITFIGNKAGLLETTLQLKRLIFTENIDMTINVISKKFSTLNKASFSDNFKTYKLKIFTKNKIKKIKNANDILFLLKKEFSIGISNKFNKYDIWTTILKKNILNSSISKLNLLEKKKYNLLIFPKIRNITRFTFPGTVLAKNFLERKKKIKIIKGKCVSIRKLKNKILVMTDTKKQIESDIVVNVSGPVDLQSLNNESKLIKIIKNLEGKFDKRGFLTDRNFMLSNKIFMPGTLAYNFNPLRQTIIKAVTNNSRKAINFLLKENNLI